MTAHRLLHDIRIIRTNTGNHAKHIAVYCRNRLIICNRSNCTGSIRSDSFEFQQFLIGIRYHPTVFIHNLLRRCIQVPHPIVISQPLPKFQIPVLRTFCQRPHIRKLRNKSLKIWLYRLYPRLLQHNLGNPHIISTWLIAPRKNTRMCIKPVLERLCYLHQIKIIDHSFRSYLFSAFFHSI